MINTFELRTGNLVKCKTSNDAGIYTVMAIDGINLKTYLNEPRNVWHTEYKLKPIPLNEQWLIKLGFEKKEVYLSGLKFDGWLNFSFHLDINHIKGTFFYHWIGGNIEVKYVHQLQNLYFSLHDKELTTKES